MLRVVGFIVEILILVCVYWFVFFFSALIHEFGHALVYMIVTGDSHWHIRIGAGKTLLKTQRLTIKFAPFYGFFEPYENKLDTKAKSILMLLGGPLFSLIMVVLLLFIRLKTGTFDFGFITLDAIINILSLAFFLNISTFLFTIVPMRYFWGEHRGMPSDGLRIFKIVKSM